MTAVCSSQTASFTSIGVGCGGSPPGIYEQFDAVVHNNDLQLRSLNLIYTGSSYVAIGGNSPLITPVGPPMVFYDDQTQVVQLPFALPHPGGVTDRLWICSNGWIALEQTSETTYTESPAALRNGPARVCAFWDDLHPGHGGAIHAGVDANDPTKYHVTWTGVPEYSYRGANTFQVTFSDSGQIELRWDTMSALDGIVGYHPGHGATIPHGRALSNLSALVLGSGGLPLLLNNPGGTVPVLGRPFDLIVDQLPYDAGFGAVVLGLRGIDPAIDLGSIGMTDCHQYVTTDFIAPFLVGGASAHVPLHFEVPNAAMYSGLQCRAQAVAWAASVPGGAATSNAAVLVLGTQ